MVVIGRQVRVCLGLSFAVRVSLSLGESELTSNSMELTSNLLVSLFIFFPSIFSCICCLCEGSTVLGHLFIVHEMCSITVGC